VYRNDKSPSPDRGHAPDRIVISPGPARRRKRVSRRDDPHFAEDTSPRVCLGHQSIARPSRRRDPRTLPHARKTSMIHHDGKTIFTGLPNPSRRPVHSLIINRDPAVRSRGLGWTKTASSWGAAQAIQGGRRAVPPESILTGAGKDLLRNFLSSSEHGKDNIFLQVNRRKNSEMEKGEPYHLHFTFFPVSPVQVAVRSL